jgi:hypothetical protein
LLPVHEHPPIARHGRTWGARWFFGRAGVLSFGMAGGFVAMAIALMGYLAVQGWPLKLGGGGVAQQVLDLGFGGGDSPAGGSTSAPPGPVAHPLRPSAGPSVQPETSFGGAAGPGGRSGAGHRGSRHGSGKGGGGKPGSQKGGGNPSNPSGGQTQAPPSAIPQQPAAPAKPQPSSPPASSLPGSSKPHTTGGSHTGHVPPGQAKKQGTGGGAPPSHAASQGAGAPPGHVKKQAGSASPGQAKKQAGAAASSNGSGKKGK